MKNIKKIFLLTFILFTALILLPNFSNAATTYSVYDVTTLTDALNTATSGDTIKLTANIALTSPIEINGKSLTIDGAGFTISRNTNNWSPNGPNGTLITAGGSTTTLTLKNLNLRGSQKYGVQAYDGGHVILNGVTIANCEYGGVLVNGGTLEIIDLTLYRNRNNGDANNGIEIGKASNLTNDPKIIMNGTLSSDQTENVLYLATNDSLTNFDVENAEGTKDKILASGNKVVVTDENNNILFQSNSNANVEVEGTSDYVPNVIITIVLPNNKTTTVSVQNGTTLTKETLAQRIKLEELGFANYTVAGFYTTAEFSQEYDFKTPITQAVTIYAKLNAKATAQPDVTPKTGVETPIELAMFIFAISTLAVVMLKRK